MGKLEQIFCKCGEYLAVKWLETNEIEIDSEVDYEIGKSNKTTKLICPYCEEITLVCGKVVEI